MTWNYRVMKRLQNKEELYEIHEVYYDKNKEIEGYTENPINPCGNTLEELKKDLDRMQEALNKAILDYSEEE
jgi:hypothetical protein